MLAPPERPGPSMVDSVRAPGLFGRLRPPNPLVDPRAAGDSFASRVEVDVPDVPFEELRPVLTESLGRHGYPAVEWTVPDPSHPAWTPEGRLAYCAAESSVRLDRHNARVADAFLVASLLSIALGLTLAATVPVLEQIRALVILLAVIGPSLVTLGAFVAFPSQFTSELLVVRLQAKPGVEWPPRPTGFLGLKRVDYPPMPRVARVVLEAGFVLTENLDGRTVPAARGLVRALRGGRPSPIPPAIAYDLRMIYRIGV